MKNPPLITKKQILDYLEYAPEQVDSYKLSCWLEAMSQGTLYVTKGKRPNLSIAKQLKRIS